MRPKLTLEEEALLFEEVLLRADKARQDPEAFFEFVVKEQATRKPIAMAPHQRVAMRFMEDHDRCVNIWPVGAAKTFTVAMMTVRLLGQDPTSRGLVVSETQEQAKKVISVVSDYIEHSPELRLVYPNLRPSRRSRDAWTQTHITVERPPGIPDPSLVACGMDKGVAGARLNWVIIDDILSRKNTATQEQRDKVREFLDSTVLKRMDPMGAKVIINNSAWHPDDIVHRLERAGWAVLRMDVLGNVQIQDDRVREERAKYVGDVFEPWTHPELRPASPSPAEVNYRLKGHDPDPKNEVPLFPERFYYLKDEKRGLAPASNFEEAVKRCQEWIREERSTNLPVEFNRAYLGIARDDGTAQCKEEWVDQCKRIARTMGHTSMTSIYRGTNPTFTGLDLAFREGEDRDFNVFFTFEALPTGHRRILDIEYGQWDSPTVADKLVAKQKAYNSVVRVENNGAQNMLLQFLRKKDVSIPLKEHTTGNNKAQPEFGVQGVFLDMYNGAWLIPNDRHGGCHDFVQRWIDECLYYVPTKHTGDGLMASWFAREMAREWGMLNPVDPNAANGNGSIAMNIMSR